MPLNPGIILSGSNPDLVNSFGRGQVAGAQQKDFQSKNKLREFLSESGPDVLAGDQNALNELSRFDPQASLGIQDSKLQIKQREQTLQTAKESGARAARAEARLLSAAQRAEEVKKIDKALAMATQAKTAEDWDAIMSQLQLTDLVGGFENKDIIFAGALGIKDALSANAPEFVTDVNKRRRNSVTGELQFPDVVPDPEKDPESIRALKIRADSAGLVEGTQERAQFMLNGGKFPKTSSISVDADGNVKITEGPQGETTGGKFTESQAKTNTFAVRARGALGVFEPVSETLTNRSEQFAEGVPFNLGRGVQSEDFQVATQAGDEFLQAILRKDTGAAITEGEQVLYGRTYLPQPGDKPSVLEAKKNSRSRAVTALEAGMSPLQILVVDQALIRDAESQATTGGEVNTSQQAGDKFSQMGVQDLVNIDVTTLNASELASLSAALEKANQ